MRIVVDHDRCIMSGECYYNHPELFQPNTAGYPIVQVELLDTEALKSAARQAVDVCPAFAIEVEAS